jgi:copper homeostasis protein
MPVKEIPVDHITEALEARRLGAGRIELCDNLQVGGTTPSYGTIRTALRLLDIPVMVMIRPRGGDFCYSDAEFEVMRQDVDLCRQLGAAGVVFGLLDPMGRVDAVRTRTLVELAGPLQITFHKAIDETADLPEALETIAGLGIQRVLTSGGEPTALDGASMLRRLIRQADGRTGIIVAGKVTADNFAEVSRLVPAREYHGRLLLGPLS